MCQINPFIRAGGAFPAGAAQVAPGHQSPHGGQNLSEAGELALPVGLDETVGTGHQFAEHLGAAFVDNRGEVRRRDRLALALRRHDTSRLAGPMRLGQAEMGLEAGAGLQP